MPKQHQIMSDWMPADESKNRLELAATEEDGVIAIRDSFDPERQVFATVPQLRALRRFDEARLTRLTGS